MAKKLSMKIRTPLVGCPSYFSCKEKTAMKNKNLYVPDKKMIEIGSYKVHKTDKGS